MAAAMAAAASPPKRNVPGLGTNVKDMLAKEKIIQNRKLALAANRAAAHEALERQMSAEARNRAAEAERRAVIEHRKNTSPKPSPKNKNTSPKKKSPSPKKKSPSPKPKKSVRFQNERTLTRSRSA